MATTTETNTEADEKTSRPLSDRLVGLLDERYRQLQATGIGRITLYTSVTIYLLWTLFPVYWLISATVKTRGELLATPPQWLPTEFTIENYVTLFLQRPEFVQYIINSIVVSMISTVLAVTLGVMATYGFVRYDFPYDVGQLHLPLLILASRFLPPIVVVIPVYIIFVEIGIINTPLALIIAYTAFNFPFIVWLMKGFFEELPESVIQAAILDGHTEIGAFFKIVIPMVKPGIIASILFVLMGSWNELLFAVILTSNIEAQTLPVGLATFQTQYFVEWELLTVASTIAMAPVVLFAFIVRDHLLRGFTMGAIE